MNDQVSTGGSPQAATPRRGSLSVTFTCPQCGHQESRDTWVRAENAMRAHRETHNQVSS